MPSAVVFDTNAYQSLPSARLEELLAAEARDDVLALADSWVMIELISKLTDDSTRRHARAALRKQLKHCGDPQPRMVIDCEDQLCRLLLGVTPADHAKARERITAITERVARADAADGLADVLPAANELHTHVLQVENERGQSLMDNFIRLAVPEAVSWDAIVKSPKVQAAVRRWLDSGDSLRALAASTVLLTYNAAHIAPPSPLPEALIQKVLQHFPFPLAVEAAVLRGIVDRGWDLTTGGRENCIWDAEIAFNAGQPLAGGRQITLVTDDRLLLDVAAAEKVAAVLPLGAYLAERGIAA